MKFTNDKFRTRLDVGAWSLEWFHANPGFRAERFTTGHTVGGMLTAFGRGLMLYRVV